jgi:hypothetical protein
MSLREAFNTVGSVAVLANISMRLDFFTPTVCPNGRKQLTLLNIEEGRAASKSPH